MSDVYDKIKATAKGMHDRYEAGQKQTSGLGAELAARSQMNRVGEEVLHPTASKEPAASGSEPSHSQGPYGSRPGEKRLDSEGNEIPKYHTGVDSVPKTGLAVVKKGEKIIAAEHNPENPDNKNAVEQAFDGEDKMTEHTDSEKQHFHRAMSKLHEGGLHEHFGMSKDTPISMEKKQEAANSDNKHVAAMGRLAVAMHGWGSKK
jgi:hypothetical protein